MKIETKKVIAREFLLFVLAVGLGILTYLSTFLYNYYQMNDSNKIKFEISRKQIIADSLMNPLLKKREKHAWFYRKNNEKVDLSRAEYNSPEKLWDILDNYEEDNLIIYKYQNKWSKELKELLREIGFENAQELIEFIKANRISNTEKKNFEKGKKIELEINELGDNLIKRKSKILNSTRQLEIGLFAFCIAFSLLFAARYIYYSIIWSIEVLRA
jgi:hypothetical protein